MTPAQKKALIAYRDRGTKIKVWMRRILVRDGHLAPDQVTLLTLRPEDIPIQKTIGEQVEALFRLGRTLDQVCEELGLTKRQVYNTRNRIGMGGKPMNPFNLKRSALKSRIKVGSPYEFLAAHPDIEQIFDLAAHKNLTLLEAAGRLLRGNQKPYPVFRRSVCLRDHGRSDHV